MYHPYPDDRAKAIELAQNYISSDPLFLDTETTGLSGMHEICEIAIVNLAGEVLINTLVRPTCPIDFNTSQIHGITDDLVKDAPTFGDLLPRLEQVLRGRTVLIYNAEFDIAKLERSAIANDCQLDPWWRALPVKPDVPEGHVQEFKTSWHCAMELYAQFYGDWHDYHHSYRWQRLSNAALQCGVDLPLGTHRALVDAELTRQVVLSMAEKKDIQTLAPHASAGVTLPEEENKDE